MGQIVYILALVAVLTVHMELVKKCLRLKPIWGFTAEIIVRVLLSILVLIGPLIYLCISKMIVPAYAEGLTKQKREE